MAVPLIVPIAAGVGSFLLAKASGASNRDALIAGGIGALGAYGVGTAAGLGTSSVAAKGTIASALGGSEIAAAATGIGGATLGTMAMQGQPKQAQANENMNVGFKGVDPAQYAQATENLQGITQRANYADAPQTDVAQPSVYDFTNQAMYTAKEGGLAEIKRFREGGVNYLPLPSST